MMDDDPLFAAALPADDAASVWLASLAWTFGDMQIVHVYLIEGHDKLSEGLSEAALFYGYRLAAAHYREAAKLCRLVNRPEYPEIRAFHDSLPEDDRQHLVDALAAYAEFDEQMRSLRNGLFHYPYLDGYDRDTFAPRPGQARWDQLRELIAERGGYSMTTVRGKFREARFSFADDLAAQVVEATVGGPDAFAALAVSLASAITGLMRFINAAIDERMTRAALELPLDRPRA